MCYFSSNVLTSNYGPLRNLKQREASLIRLVEFSPGIPGQSPWKYKTHVWKYMKVRRYYVFLWDGYEWMSKIQPTGFAILYYNTEMQYIYNTFVVTSTSHPNLWVTKLFHIFKLSLSLDPTSATKTPISKTVKRTVSQVFQDTLFGLLSNLPFGLLIDLKWCRALFKKKILSSIDLVGFFCSILCLFSVLMSLKTWTSAARQRHWCWTFLLETCFSWFLVLGLRQFCRSFKLYVVEQTSAIKTRNREMLTVACSVFLFN